MAELQGVLEKIGDMLCHTNYQGALSLSIEAEKQFPQDPLLWCQRSAILERMGDKEGAVAAAKKTIPLWPGGYLYTMRLYERLGDLPNALRLVDEALADPRIKPNRELQTSILNQKATFLLHQGKTDAALNVSDQALRSLSEGKHVLRARLLKTRAEILDKLHRKQEAETCLTEAAKLEQQVGIRTNDDGMQKKVRSNSCPP